MTRERLTGIDQGTLLVERMLGNREVLHTLITGGRNKDTILKKVVSELGSDTAVQACFLRTLFRNIAREGPLEITNRRDAAMAILTDTSSVDEVSLNAVIAPLVKGNSTAVHYAYIEAVQQQTRENDPFSGSVDALLEVGKAIAPHMSQDAQRKQEIINAWEIIVEKFHAVDQRLHICLKLEDIKLDMSFDAKVEELIKEGLSKAEIAQQLGRKITDINVVAHRLSADRRIKRTKSSEADAVQLDSRVEELRKQGFSCPKIAQQLGRKESNIKTSVRRLIAAGRIERLKRGGRFKG